MPIRPRISLDNAVDFLNTLVAHDPAAAKALMEARVAFKGGTLDAIPSLQGYRVEEMVGSHDLVGLLGVLNGMFGSNENGEGPIAAWYEKGEDGTPVFARFVVVRRPG